MDNYSFDTVQLIRNFFSEQRQAERARASCLRAMQKTCPEARLEGDLPPADYHAIELSFDAISDERVRVCLENLPTSFALEEAQVTLLRQAGRALLMGSREFQEAMRQIDADWRPAAEPLDPGVIAKACPETTPPAVAR